MKYIEEEALATLGVIAEQAADEPVSATLAATAIERISERKAGRSVNPEIVIRIPDLFTARGMLAALLNACFSQNQPEAAKGEELRDLLQRAVDEAAADRLRREVD